MPAYRTEIDTGVVHQASAIPIGKILFCIFAALYLDVLAARTLCVHGAPEAVRQITLPSGFSYPHGAWKRPPSEAQSF
jgi:hypothetical protein